MGAVCAIEEDALNRDDVRQEIDDLDAALGGNGQAQAICISFFSQPVDLKTISSAPNDWLIGQATLIKYAVDIKSEFDHGYIYEAIFSTPHIPQETGPLLNNYLCPPRKFSIKVLNHVFSINSFYYAQQNGVSGVCAHACLRMVLNSTSFSSHTITNTSINKYLGVMAPSAGLTINELERVIESCGLRAQVTACDKLDATDYLATLYSIVESGYPALLVFSTNSQENHVVSVVGHTSNSDEWHPEAMFAYLGQQPDKHYSSSLWADHYVIHDDNFGPYYCLSSRALESDPDLRASHIVGIYPSDLRSTPTVVEAISSFFVEGFLSNLAGATAPPWLKYIVDKPRKFVLRTLLAEKDAWMLHLKHSSCHDGSVVLDEELNIFRKFLPPRFWVSEITLPNLFVGNRSKLGEVYILSDQPPNVSDHYSVVFGIRLPGQSYWRESGNFVQEISSLKSHHMMFRAGHSGREW